MREPLRQVVSTAKNSGEINIGSAVVRMARIAAAIHAAEAVQSAQQAKTFCEREFVEQNR